MTEEKEAKHRAMEALYHLRDRIDDHYADQADVDANDLFRIVQGRLTSLESQLEAERNCRKCWKCGCTICPPLKCTSCITDAPQEGGLGG